MGSSNSSTIKYIDRALFVFVAIFLVSLTNSIFVNQLGYFGALLLLIAKSVITKENAFRKTGLEAALLLMIASEVLSTIFSVNRSQSVHFALKFLLLIPILYTFSSATEDLKTAKLYFKIFIGAALVSCAIYLVLAYDYFIYNQFQITQSGPSPFQYPITASELISFVVIFLFAFAVNEKGNFKKRIFLWLMFFIALAALLSIYKRTGWMGAFAGIIFILIYLRKWKLILPLLAVLVFMILTEKNESNLLIYEYRNSDLKKIEQIKTEGRIWDINFDSTGAVISDYENGLLFTNNFKSFSNLKTPTAVVSFFSWQNYYCALLFDSRFVLYKKTANGLAYKTEFISPGYLSSYAVSNGCLYTADSDSGLTVFRNPENLMDTVRVLMSNRQVKIEVDSTTLATSSYTTLEIFKLQNNIPVHKIAAQNFKSNFGFLGKKNDQYYVSENGHLAVYELVGDELKLYAVNKNIPDPYIMTFNKDTIFVATLTNEVVSAVAASGDVKVLSRNNFGFSPKKIFYDNEKLYLTHVIQGRLFSFVDKYNPSNSGRFSFWRAGWHIFLDHPIFGVGNIDLADLYLQYKRPSDKEVQGHMHNNFVQFLVTLGMVGIAASVFLFFSIFKKLLQIYKRVNTIPFISSHTLGVLGGIVSFLVAGLTEWNFGDHEIITMVWFTVGLAVAFDRIITCRDNKKETVE